MEYRISINILSICIIWLQIWNLHTRATLDFSFLSICTFTSWVVAIVVLVPLMAQVAETRDTSRNTQKIRNFHPSQCWHVIFNTFAYFNLLLGTLSQQMTQLVHVSFVVCKYFCLLRVYITCFIAYSGNWTTGFLPIRIISYQRKLHKNISAFSFILISKSIRKNVCVIRGFIV